MNSKVLDRPAAQVRERARASDSVTNPRDKIIWKMSELQASIAQMVDAEQGDCVGRVFEYAGKRLASGARAFSVTDEINGYGHPDMIEAESFIKAAAALAVEECDGQSLDGRAVIARRLADDMDALTTEVDTYAGEISRREVSRPAVVANSKGETAQNLGAEAEGWVDIAIETLQTRLQALNSNVAYGLRSLMRVAKSAIDGYNQSLPGDGDAYDNATEQLGIAMDSLEAFNDDSIDDLVLYACGLSLEKARELLLASAIATNEGVVQ